MVYEKTVFVKREKAPIVSGEVDQIDVRELYDGRENPLNIDYEKRIKFTCSFDNIQNYPFGMQVSHCRLGFTRNHFEGKFLFNLFNVENPRVPGLRAVLLHLWC